MSAAKPSPTRITLLAKKRELKVAKRGHKLLKDKQDGLMREFMARIRDVRTLRETLHTTLTEGLTTYVTASALMSPQTIRQSFALGTPRARIAVKERQVMSVGIPEFSLQEDIAPHAAMRPYGILSTYGNFDRARGMLRDVLPLIVRLAALESSITRLAEEIERTRRRASALEHLRIPALEAIIRDITLRLEEQNRDAVVNTMRIKALINAKEAPAHA